MTLISPNKFVMQRCFGFPLTLLKRIGQPPSSAFWIPVISRLGSTSFSVTMRSPSDLSHSSVFRRSAINSTGARDCAALLILVLQEVRKRFTHGLHRLRLAG